MGFRPLPDRKENSGIQWSHVLVTALLTLIVSTVAGILIFNWTREEPRLVYEVFPPSSFAGEDRSLSIYTLRIENTGDKEAEDVLAIITSPEGAKFTDLTVEPSSHAMQLSTEMSSDSSVFSISAPLLNPGENVRAALLINDERQDLLSVDLRGRGTTGMERRSEDQTYLAEWIVIVIPLFAVLLALVTAIQSWISAVLGKKLRAFISDDKSAE